MHYIKFKHDLIIGKCNICPNEGALSWDHVPPKGGYFPTKMEMNNVLGALSAKDEYKKYQETQNGVKFRTICRDCNSKLNKLYDKEINKFANSLGKFLRSNLILPPVIEYEVKPVKIMKGILGHLLSVKLENLDTPFDNQIRDIIFSSNKRISNDIHIFYWIYPYQNVVILRDFGMTKYRNGNLRDVAFFQLLKYPPVAYLITDASSYQGLPELTQFRDLDDDKEIKMMINLKNIHPVDWPEVVDSMNMLFLGNSAVNSVFAKPKSKVIK